MVACMFVSTMASPIVVPDPISAIAFTTAGGLILVERKRAEYFNGCLGLVLTAASGAVTTIPTSTLLLGKTVVLKKALVGTLLNQD